MTPELECELITNDFLFRNPDLTIEQRTTLSKASEALADDRKKVQKAVFHSKKRGNRAHRRWVKYTEKKAVDDLRLQGIIPGWWTIAWWFLKPYVIELIKELLFSEVETGEV